MDLSVAFKAVFGLLFMSVFVAFSAFFSGTILWLIWPFAMVEVFAFPALTWWQAVTLTWVASILIKSSVSTKS